MAIDVPATASRMARGKRLKVRPALLKRELREADKRKRDEEYFMFDNGQLKRILEVKIICPFTCSFLLYSWAAHPRTRCHP
jgi:hypothetical protein